jgi:hypothetical protein
MSFASAAFPFDPYRKKQRPEGRGLFRQLRSASGFLRELQAQMRYGELSRAPLRLLRLNVVAETVECDWMARAPDPWDEDLSSRVKNRHASLQALRDAIEVRALLFESVPQAETAHLRVFRETAKDYRPEMIIAGSVHRNDHSSRSLHSLVMRAKILGFRFRLEGERLQRI